MQDFKYVRAHSLDEAFAALADEDARVLSGGTDLLVQLREGRRQASTVVDIKAVPELNVLRFDGAAGLELGAAVPCWRIAADPMMRAMYPGLVDGISLIGGVQVQGRATVGGNLCNASPAADAIPGLIVHEAVCVIAGPNGRRELPVEQFCTGPGRNALARGELLVSVRVPTPPANSGAAYLRFIPRNEMDIAVVGAGVAVVLSADGSRFEQARVALGAVAPTPLFVPEAGAALAGRPVTDEAIAEAGRLVLEAARPITDMRGTIAQRKHLSGVLTRRALHNAVARALQVKEVA